MQAWIIEADIYRLNKALEDAPPDMRPAVAARLRSAEASLARLRRLAAEARPTNEAIVSAC